jgi:hypothetical protein
MPSHQQPCSKTLTTQTDWDLFWTPERIALLGTEIDKVIAVQLGITVSRVFRKREGLGITAKTFAVNGKPSDYEWTPGKLALLGKSSDKVISKMIDAPLTVVKRKRQELKIPQFNPASNAPAVIPQHLIDQFNILTDGQIAKLTGYSQPTISKHRRNLGIETTWAHNELPTEADALLGKIPDVQLAKKYGVSHQAVGQRRQKLEIDRTPLPVRKSHIKAPELSEFLGLGMECI